MANVHHHISTPTKILLSTVAVIIVFLVADSAGSSFGNLESAWQLLKVYCVVALPLCIGGLAVDLKSNKALRQLKQEDRISLKRITDKYNEVTRMLQTNYKYEKKELVPHSSRQKEDLRQRFEKLYEQNREAYLQECKEYLASRGELPMSAKCFKLFWKWAVAVGVLAQVAACGYTFGIDTYADVVPRPEGTGIYWNADNIPMPHLEDATRYVANPDFVVTENTERLLNQWYCKLDDSLGIESVVVLVNHVENDDPFRMAQDIGNNYGVGREDRGLIVILAYEDHAINISPGKALEADLTDIECKRLQQDYVIPAMKADQPDSAMLLLAEAIYSTLRMKELPATPRLSAESSDSDKQAGIIGLYMMLFFGWFMLVAYLYYRYNGSSIGHNFISNPFMKPTQPVYFSSGGSGHSSSGRSFGGGGGGGFGGGSFGGGSFGGGGATSRW